MSHFSRQNKWLPLGLSESAINFFDQVFVTDTSESSFISSIVIDTLVYKTPNSLVNNHNIVYF